MSDETLTKWYAIRKAVRGIWKVRLALRDLHKRQVQFKALHAQVRELVVEPGRSPRVEPGSLAKLAAAKLC